jgi:hypothetical protein
MRKPREILRRLPLLTACAMLATFADSFAGEGRNIHTPEGASSHIRDAAGYPPKRADWHLSISPGPSGWNYYFSMYEGAESYLGTAIFDSLPERFGKIAGVSAVLQEDRELYRIRSSLQPEVLEERLWEAFLVAAKESFGQ